MSRPPRPSRPSPLDLFSFAMAAVLLASAVVVLDGRAFPGTPRDVRLVFGSVLLLLSVYRVVVTLARRRAAREAELMEQMRAEVREDVARARSAADDSA